MRFGLSAASLYAVFAAADDRPCRCVVKDSTSFAKCAASHCQRQRSLNLSIPWASRVACQRADAIAFENPAPLGLWTLAAVSLPIHGKQCDTSRATVGFSASGTCSDEDLIIVPVQPQETRSTVTLKLTAAAAAGAGDQPAAELIVVSVPRSGIKECLHFPGEEVVATFIRNEEVQAGEQQHGHNIIYMAALAGALVYSSL